MLEAKKIEAGDILTCRTPGYFASGCFHHGHKYKILEVKEPSPGKPHKMVSILCEADIVHVLGYKDLGHFLRIPILIKRNIPKWL